MPPLLRNVLAVLAGLFAGMAFNLLALQVNLQFFPLPEGVRMEDPEALKSVVHAMPLEAWAGVFIAHLGQAFVGAALAARLAASRAMTLAMIVGGFSLLGGVLNALQLEVPTWAWTEMPFYLLFAWMGGRLGRRMPAPAIADGP